MERQEKGERRVAGNERVGKRQQEQAQGVESEQQTVWKQEREQEQLVSVQKPLWWRWSSWQEQGEMRKKSICSSAQRQELKKRGW